MLHSAGDEGQGVVRLNPFSTYPFGTMDPAVALCTPPLLPIPPVEVTPLIPMAPMESYPEILRVLAWAKVSPVDSVGWGDTAFDTLGSWPSLAMWVSLLALEAAALVLLFLPLTGWARERHRDVDVLCTGLWVFMSVTLGVGGVFVLGSGALPGGWVWAMLVPLVFCGVILGLGVGVLAMILPERWERRTRVLLQWVDALRRDGRPDPTLRFLQSRWPWVDTVHEDEFGRLVRTRLGWEGQWFWAVIVRDSTTGKEHALAVDERLRPLNQWGNVAGEPQEPTARNGVASTFGLTGEQYAPVAEA